MKTYIVIGLLILLAAAGLWLLSSWEPNMSGFDQIGLPNDIPDYSDKWKTYLIFNIFVALFFTVFCFFRDIKKD